LPLAGDCPRGSAQRAISFAATPWAIAVDLIFWFSPKVVALPTAQSLLGNQIARYCETRNHYYSISLDNTPANTTVSEAAKEVFKLALRLSGIPLP